MYNWGVSRTVVASGPTKKNIMSDINTINPSTGKAYVYRGRNNAFNDSWYWQAIEKYRGTQWYDKLASNPHLVENNAAFVPDVWQDFLYSVFGNNDAERNYYGALRNQANQYLSDTLDQMRQEGYDSAPAQVAREKSAGINSDINGGQGITPGAAAENDQPSLPFPDVSTAPAFSQVAEYGLNFVTSVFGMVEGIQGMIGNQGRIAAQDIANHSSVMGFVQEELLNALSVDDISEPDKIDEGVILNVLDRLSGDTSFHSSTRKIISRYRNEVFENSGKMATLRTELAERYLKARKGTAAGLADPYYEKKLADWVGRVGQYFQDLNSAVIREFNARESKAVYEDEKYSAASGVQEGAAMTEEAIARKKIAAREGTAAENEKSALDVYNELVNFLQQDDSIWSKFGLYFMPKLDNLLNTLSGGGFKIKFDSSNRSTTQNITKTGPTVVNN